MPQLLVNWKPTKTSPADDTYRIVVGTL